MEYIENIFIYIHAILDMHVLTKTEIEEYGKILCEIGVEGRGFGQVTIIKAVLLPGKIKWEDIIRLFEKFLNCNATICMKANYGRYPVTVLSNGDHRIRVRDILLGNNMYNKDQIHIWAEVGNNLYKKRKVRVL